VGSSIVLLFAIRTTIIRLAHHKKDGKFLLGFMGHPKKLSAKTCFLVLFKFDRFELLRQPDKLAFL